MMKLFHWLKSFRHRAGRRGHPRRAGFGQRSWSAWRPSGITTADVGPIVEQLEDRTLLATFAGVGTSLNLGLETNEQLAVVSNGSTYSLSLGASGTWGGSDDANVTGTGTNVLTVTAAGIAAFTTAINVADSGPGTTVTFNDGGAHDYQNSFLVTLDDAAAGTIAFNGYTGFTAASELRAVTTRNIVVHSGATVTTVDGDLTLSANQQATPGNGQFVGIELAQATLHVRGSGDLSLAGRGGNGPLEGQGGIRAFESDLLNSGTGRITLAGTGGTGSADGNYGVAVFGAEVEIDFEFDHHTSRIRCVADVGDTSNNHIVITGHGAGAGTSGRAFGVSIGGFVETEASLTVDGTGGGRLGGL